MPLISSFIFELGLQADDTPILWFHLFGSIGERFIFYFYLWHKKKEISTIPETFIQYFSHFMPFTEILQTEKMVPLKICGNPFFNVRRRNVRFGSEAVAVPAASFIRFEPDLLLALIAPSIRFNIFVGHSYY